jgi:hypothetical protein
MKSNPDFFSLSKEEQDRYKLDNEEALDFSFKQFAHKELLGVEYQDEKFYEDLELSDSDTLELNKLSTYLRGIGDNYFYLNECFDRDKDMLTFKTIYDYDLDDHIFQEKTSMEYRPEEERTELPPYLVRLNSRWARCFLDEKDSKGNIESNFYYLILLSPAYHIYNQLEEIASNYIEKLIPHDFVQGKNHGKETKGGFVWDYRIKANGLEDPLDDLNKQSRLFIGEAFERMKVDFDNNKQNKIWSIDHSMENDPTKHYIFSDTEVVKNIRFSQWQEDTSKFLTEDITYLEDVLMEEEDKLLRFLDSSFKDILKNFDPKIKKLKRGMDVIVGKDFPS